MFKGKKTGFVIAAVAIMAFANMTLASNKGEGDKRKADSFKLNYTHSKLSVPFTLKNNLKFDRASLTSFTKSDKFVLYSSVMTYRRGNVVYMMPVKQKVFLPRFIKTAPDKK